jgi:hypothetical protein
MAGTVKIDRVISGGGGRGPTATVGKEDSTSPMIRSPLPAERVKESLVIREHGCTVYVERYFRDGQQTGSSVRQIDAPRVGAFVWVENGWGQRTRGKICCVTPGEIGLSFHATGGPFFWAKLSERGTSWDLE